MRDELCPICSAVMPEYTDFIDFGVGSGPISEHYVSCPNKCYAYEYAYGYTTIHVKDQEFGWSYQTDVDTRNTEIAAMDAFINVNKAQRS